MTTRRHVEKWADIAHKSTGDVMNTEAHDAYADWFMDTGDRLRRALETP